MGVGGCRAVLEGRQEIVPLVRALAVGSSGFERTSAPTIPCARGKPSFPTGRARGRYGSSEAPAPQGLVGVGVRGGEGGPRLPGGLRGDRRLSAGQSGGQRWRFRLRHRRRASGRTGQVGQAGCRAAATS